MAHDGGMNNTATTVGINSSGQTVRIIEGRRYFSVFVADRNFGTFAQFNLAADFAARFVS